jgi:citrate synthase
MSDFVKGLAGIVAAETNMSFIDGQEGILEYVGIPIGELASKGTFEEPSTSSGTRSSRTRTSSTRSASSSGATTGCPPAWSSA